MTTTALWLGVVAPIFLYCGLHTPGGDPAQIDPLTRQPFLAAGSGQPLAKGSRGRWMGVAAHALLLEAAWLVMVGSSVSWLHWVCWPLAALSALASPWWLARRIAASKGFNLPLADFLRHWLNIVWPSRARALTALLVTLPMAGWGLYLAGVVTDVQVLWFAYAGWLLGVIVPAAHVGTTAARWSGQAMQANTAVQVWVADVLKTKPEDLGRAITVNADASVTVRPLPAASVHMSDEELEQRLVDHQPDRAIAFRDEQTVTFGWADETTRERRAATKGSGGLVTAVLSAAAPEASDGPVIDLTNGLTSSEEVAW